MDVPEIISAVGGIGGGAITVGAITKIMIARFIKENDKKHETSDKRQTALSKDLRQQANGLSALLNSIKIDIEVIKARMGEVMTIRDDVKEHEKVIAIMGERVDGNSRDLNRGLKGARENIERLHTDITNLKQAGSQHGR